MAAEAPVDKPEFSSLEHDLMLFDESVVDAVIDAMATDILAQGWKSNETVYVGFLKGAVPFVADLERAMQRHDPSYQPNVVWAQISTRGDERVAHEPQLLLDLPQEYHDLTDRPIRMVFLDDTVDEQITLGYATEKLAVERGLKPENVKRIVLVEKVGDTALPLSTTMSGFIIPKWAWAIGKGLNGPSEDHRFDPWIGIAGDTVLPDEYAGMTLPDALTKWYEDHDLLVPPFQLVHVSLTEQERRMQAALASQQLAQ